MQVGIMLLVAALAVPGAHVVRGVIRGPDGQLVDKADVWLCHRYYAINGLPETHVLSAADGRFAMPLPAEAPFGRNFELGIVVVKPGAGFAATLLDARFPPLHTLQFELEACVPVTLQISDPEGRPIIGAKSSMRGLATDAHGGGTVALQTTEADYSVRRTNQRGEVTLELPRSLRSFGLAVEATGFGTQMFNSDAAVRSFRLSPVGKLRGRLIRESPKSIADSRVFVMSFPTMQDASGVGGGGLAEARTDEQGFFEVPALVAGDVRVWWVEHAPKSTIFLNKQVQCLLPAGESREIEVPGIPGVRVYGKVIDGETARPLPGIRAHVSLNQSRGGTASWSVLTDNDGKYEAFVPPGAGQGFVQFGPLPAPYVGASVPVSGDLRGEFPNEGEELEMPEFLVRPGITLVGKVIDSRKQPVSTARVQAASVDPSSGVYHRVIAETDSDGKFSIGPLDDQAVVALMASDDTRVSPDVIIWQPDNPRKNIVLPIDKSKMVSLSGRVVDDRNEPIGGVTVYVGPEMSLMNWEFDAVKALQPVATLAIETDKQGRFALPCPVPLWCRYYVDVYGNGFERRKPGVLKAFEFEPGEQTLGDLELKRLPPPK